MAHEHLPQHALAQLRQRLLASATRPFLARGGKVERCPACRVRPGYCFCALRPKLNSTARFCLLMHRQEPLKPSNTGWLIADLLPDTEAFIWQRTEVDPRLLALLADPNYQAYVVFPGEFVEASRVHHQLPEGSAKTPLFILLDATWPQARKMFRKSPYLDQLPILSLLPEVLSRYRLRRSKRDDHLCTAEVAALCLEQAGDEPGARTLDAYLDVFAERYLASKNNWPCQAHSPAIYALAEAGRGHS